MASISINNDRIKTIDITLGDKVAGTARFNPFDVSIYKKYVGLLAGLEKDEAKRLELSREASAIEKECAELEPDLFDDGALEPSEYEQLNAYYQKKQQRRELGRQLGDSFDGVFAEIKKGIDAIFGEGIYDLLSQGFQDEGMITPLLEAAGPFFEEAAKERGERVDAAKLNREQRRARMRSNDIIDMRPKPHN